MDGCFLNSHSHDLTVPLVTGTKGIIPHIQFHSEGSQASHLIFLSTLQSPVSYCFSRSLSLLKKKLFAYYFIVPLLLQQKQYDTGTERLGCMKCTVHLPAPISFLTLFYCTVTEEKEIKEMVRSGSRGSEGKKEGE
jgi:hypothetical protein